MTNSSCLGAWLIASVYLFSMPVFANGIQPDANEAPRADAGLARSVVVGEVVTLDASGSTDRDGDRLKFQWRLQVPPGSGALLSDAAALQPQFTVDLLGDYIAELVVTDGKVESAVDTVTISTGNVAPVAVIDPKGKAGVGETIVLDGSLSWDFNGDPLDYHWSLVTAPAGSRALMQASRTASPSFTADVAGDYLLELTVSDGRHHSEPAQVWLNTEYSRLIADAGPDRRAYAGTRLVLNASPSLAKDRMSGSFQWSLLYAPETSRAELKRVNSATPVLDVDVPGQYLVQLLAHDGLQSSNADTLVITAIQPSAVGAAPTRLGSMDVDGDGIPDDIDNCAEHFNPSQLDTNSDGFGNRCDADLDNDGFITNFGDLTIWAAAFNSSPASANWNPDADFNGDNAVNFGDLFIFQAFFLSAPGPIVNRFINPLGGSWHDPANWSLGEVPDSRHSARIDIGAGVTVEYSTGVSEIAALRSGTEMIFSGGELGVNGDMKVNAAVTLSGGGTLLNANILAPDTPDSIVLTAANLFTLDNVTLGADLTIENGADLRVNDDLTLSGGATITLSSDNSF
ncbi:MAG: hypothetical protein HKN70_08265, partial [Gammaproteobacteria bacterium]|nr:hypothetical protein [Gammaproteobacteria bacterium]